MHDIVETSRANCVERLRSLTNNELPILMSFLGNPDGNTRCDAATALLKIDQIKYLEMIIPLLKDIESYVRWHIAGLLHDFGDKRATDPLTQAILTDPDADVRHQACFALSAVGDPRALPALLKVIDNDAGEDDEGRPVRDMAREAYNMISSRHQTEEGIGWMK